MEKSRKLQQEESEGREHYVTREEQEARGAAQVLTDTEEGEDAGLPPVEEEGPVLIRPIESLNDWVVILQDVRQSTIEVTGDGMRLPAGFVIGVPAAGNGVPDGNGGRLASQCKIGERVLFSQRNVVHTIKPDNDPVYNGKTIVILSEKNIFTKIMPQPFELVSGPSQVEVKAEGD